MDVGWMRTAVAGTIELFHELADTMGGGPKFDECPVWQMVGNAGQCRISRFGRGSVGQQSRSAGHRSAVGAGALAATHRGRGSATYAERFAGCEQEAEQLHRAADRRFVGAHFTLRKLWVYALE